MGAIQVPTIKTNDVGQCYDATYRMLLEAMPADAILVHGYPLCSDDEHRGKKMGHAWIEVERFGQVWCINYTKPDKLIHQRVFYHFGQIDPAECKRYTLRQAAANAVRYETAGPWGKQPKDVYFAERP